MQTEPKKQKIKYRPKAMFTNQGTKAAGKRIKALINQKHLILVINYFPGYS